MVGSQNIVTILFSSKNIFQTFSQACVANNWFFTELGFYLSILFWLPWLLLNHLNRQNLI